MRETISNLIDEFNNFKIPEYLKRKIKIKYVKGKVNFINGIRRSGKTWFIYQQIDDLLNELIPRKEILYLDFEDERLLPLTNNELRLIPEIYYYKNPDFKKKKCYFFFENIKKITGWEEFISKLNETENVQITIADHITELDLIQLIPRLKTRLLLTNIHILNFTEFLEFHDINFKKNKQFISSISSLIQNTFDKYLKTGGFPEIQLYQKPTQYKIIQQIINSTIFKDVILANKVSNIFILDKMFKYILKNPKNKFSVNHYYNMLKKDSIQCTKNSLYDYLKYLINTELFYLINIYSKSKKVQNINPQKIYIADLGIINAFSSKNGLNKITLLENLVFLHLKHNNYKVNYYVTKKGKEINFIASKNNKNLIILICWEFQLEEKRINLLSSLQNAINETGIDNGIIINWMDEQNLPDLNIKIIPAWKWLLSPIDEYN